MEHTTSQQLYEPNMNRESTIQKMTKLIQLNAETLFKKKILESSYAYNNAESVSTKLYDAHIVPSGDFSTKNIIHVMSNINLHESEFTAKETEIEKDYQSSVDAVKRQCDVKKLNIDTESTLYRYCPEDAIRVHTENCDLEYKNLICNLEYKRSNAKCMLINIIEYAIELCEVDLFVRPRDYANFCDSLMSLNLSVNAFKFIDNIVNMHFEERRRKKIPEHYACLTTLDDYVSVHEVLSNRVHVDYTVDTDVQCERYGKSRYHVINILH